jgi:hypothetical protein
VNEQIVQWLKQCLEGILTALDENDLYEVRAIIIEMMEEVEGYE